MKIKWESFIWINYYLCNFLWGTIITHIKYVPDLFDIIVNKAAYCYLILKKAENWVYISYKIGILKCEFEQPPGDSERQESLACCSPRCHKKLDTTERLNNKGILRRARLWMWKRRLIVTGKSGDADLPKVWSEVTSPLKSLSFLTYKDGDMLPTCKGYWQRSWVKRHAPPFCMLQR